MIDVVATVTVREDALEEYLEKFKANLPNVLAEKGCIHYYPTVDCDTGWKRQAKDPRAVTVIERWESMEALQAHAQAPHMAALREATKGLVTAVQLKVLRQA